MGGFYSVISFSMIAERQGLAVKMDDSFLISLGFSCQLKSQDFWRLHWIFFFFQDRVLRDFSYVTLPLEVHLLRL